MISFDAGASDVQVWGPYASMAPLIPLLKREGFTYEGVRQVWSRSLEGWEGWGEVERQIDALNGPAVQRAEARSAVVKALVQEAIVGPWCGFVFQAQEDAILLCGRIDRLRGHALAAGGKGQDQAIRFALATLEPTAFRRLLEAAKGLADEYRERIAVVDQIVGPARIREWPFAGASVAHNDNPRRVELRIPEALAPLVQDMGGRWHPRLGRWTMKAISAKPHEWRRLVARLDECEAAARAAAGPGAAPPLGGRPLNKREGTCGTCGRTVGVGQGYVRRFFDDDLEREVEEVHHADCG